MEKCLNSKLNDIIKEKAICLKNLKIVTEDEVNIEILIKGKKGQLVGCLLYTSDAADDLQPV